MLLIAVLAVVTMFWPQVVSFVTVLTSHVQTFPGICCTHSTIFESISLIA